MDCIHYTLTKFDIEDSICKPPNQTGSSADGFGICCSYFAGRHCYMAQLQCNADTCIMTYSSGDIAINLYRSMDKFSRRQIDDIFLLFPENRI